MFLYIGQFTWSPRHVLPGSLSHKGCKNMHDFFSFNVVTYISLDHMFSLLLPFYINVRMSSFISSQ